MLNIDEVIQEYEAGKRELKNDVDPSYEEQHFLDGASEFFIFLV